MFVIPLSFYDFLLQGEKVAVYPALSMPLVGIGTLCFVECNINAEKYINIIDTNLWPVIARHFPQDNYFHQHYSITFRSGL
jgi:hypothetical protein